jgi:predicted 3-demethylubiquinone-9 3-methyltransferase (glyoxalase superfamily)
MQKIVPFLWFDGKAEEAAQFYVSIFKNSKILSATPMAVTFQLEGQPFYALNGGPQYKFTPAISLFVNCETQQEVDDLWGKLSASKADEQCGWLKDKYGLSWQIIPTVLGKLMGDKNPNKANAAVQAMLKMKKIDIKGLQQAYDAA